MSFRLFVCMFFFEFSFIFHSKTFWHYFFVHVAPVELSCVVSPSPSAKKHHRMKKARRTRRIIPIVIPEMLTFSTDPTRP